MHEPGLSQWKQLYEAASAVKKLAPWEWMAETDIFGVKDPQSDQIGFVSVMGTLGEHLAVAVYMGAKNVHAFWDLLRRRESADPQELLELYQLQASFEDREFVRPEDRRVMKSLNLKFRGRQAYPIFRAYHPAQFPWFLSVEETRILTLALEQTLIVASCLQQNPELFDDYDAEHFLVRVQTESGWQDQDLHIPAPPPELIPLQTDEALFKSFKKIPQSRLDLELDLFMTRSPVQDKSDERPYYPYALLMMDPLHDQIVVMELLIPLPDLASMYSQVPLTIIQKLAGTGLRPRRITVKSLRLFGLLKSLERESGFVVQFSPHLPMLEQAKASFINFYRNRF